MEKVRGYAEQIISQASGSGQSGAARKAPLSQRIFDLAWDQNVERITIMINENDIPAKPPTAIGKFNGQRISVYAISTSDHLLSHHDERAVNDILQMKIL